MKAACLIVISVFLLNACGDYRANLESQRKISAERFFRGVYGCNPSVVDDLAADEVVISYPIFSELFQTSAIRGRDAVRDFATGFCSRWADAEITIHEAVAEGDKVVLVWHFKARRLGSLSGDGPSTNQVHSWGGITLFRFDGAGKIVAEIGEESDPGPVQRLEVDGAEK